VSYSYAHVAHIKLVLFAKTDYTQSEVQKNPGSLALCGIFEHTWSKVQLEIQCLAQTALHSCLFLDRLPAVPRNHVYSDIQGFSLFGNEVIILIRKQAA
jgi:hypothetical protein